MVRFSLNSGQLIYEGCDWSRWMRANCKFLSAICAIFLSEVFQRYLDKSECVHNMWEDFGGGEGYGQSAIGVLPKSRLQQSLRF